MASSSGVTASKSSGGADHEGERAGLGADDAAGDRRVDGAVAGRDGESAASRASSTAIVEQSMKRVPGAATSSRPGGAAGAAVGVEEVLAAGQHGQHDGGACRGLGRRPGGGNAVLPGGVERRRDDVEAGHRVAGLDQVDGHGSAHVAEAQEGDGAGWTVLLQTCCVSVVLLVLLLWRELQLARAQLGEVGRDIGAG